MNRPLRGKSAVRFSAVVALALILAALLPGCSGFSIQFDVGESVVVATSAATETPMPTATPAPPPADTPALPPTEPAATATPSGSSGSIAKPEATAAPASTATLAAESGNISGKLSYPSEFIPPLRIVAFAVGSDTWYAVDAEANQREYLLGGLPPGTYHVVAYLRDSPQTGLAGGYSQMVPCGLSADCTDHSLVDVEVRAGETTTGIDPGDWYAPEGAFPPDPAG